MLRARELIENNERNRSYVTSLERRAGGRSACDERDSVG